MSDGALRADVIAVLKQHDVDVTEVGEGRVRIAFGADILETIWLGPVVSRKRLARFQQQFDIAIGSFYRPVSKPPEKNAASS